MELKGWGLLAIFILVGLLILVAFVLLYPIPKNPPSFLPTELKVDSSSEECTSGEKISCTDSEGCPGTKTCTHGSWSSCVSPRECTPGETKFCSLGSCDSGIQICDTCSQWGPCLLR